MICTEITHVATGNRSPATETPFLRFWRAVNDARRLNGRPDLTYGPAQVAWRIAVGEI